MTGGQQQTLYERLGGYNAIAACSDDLTERLYDNATLNANPAIAEFHHKENRAGFKYILTNWVVQYTGGPKSYHGKPLGEAHSHLNITEREFDIVMNECRTTFYKFNVPEPELEELMGILESYRAEIIKGMDHRGHPTTRHAESAPA